METEKEPETKNQKQKIKKWRERILLYAPLLIWIGVILFLGSGQGSMNRTSLIIRPILEFLFPAAPEETLQLYHGFIRKFAHFAEYGVLAFFACRVLASHSLSRIKVFVLSVLLVVCVASLDEFNQSFEASRTSSPNDVLLDSVGGVFAAGCYLLFKRWRDTEV